MSFEAWRRALLVRSGVFGTLQREWRRERTRDAERANTSLERLTKDLARLQHAVERVEQQLTKAGARTKQLDEKNDRRAAEIGGLRAGIVEGKSRIDALHYDIARAELALMFNAEHRELRHAGALEPDAIAAHVASSIGAAAFSPDPMPHLLVPNLLPPATYAALLDAIPPPAFFVRAWSFFEDSVIPNMLVPALVDRLQPWIAADTSYHASSGRLMLRGPGYHLEPHLDPKRVMFTCLVYLARPGDSEAFGTQLFRIDRTPTTRRDSTFYPGEEGYRCDHVTTVPFQPNTALVFVNAGGAHGADIPETSPPTTERYAYQFYVSPACSGSSTSVI